LSTRSNFLINLLSDRPHCYGAEIGVFEGETTYDLLSNLAIEQLLCIDRWEHYDDFAAATPKKSGKVHKADFKEVKSKFKNRLWAFRDRITIVNEDSIKASGFVVDSSLDFVFIDANHAYKYVKNDIINWIRKIKIGGIICGHDYVNKNGYGVIKAVDEFFGSGFKVDGKSKVWFSEVN
jgi:predicted O-methyltransferase YrrM